MARRKVPVSPPTDLVAEAHRWAGGRSLSACTAWGVQRQVLADRRRQYLVELDEEFGPLTQEEREEGRRLWNGEV
jgi:hypothetical protein